jgi:hypothetical protein
MNPHEIALAIHEGRMTVAEAADKWREHLKERGIPDRPQFDQQERRLLYGYPIIEASNGHYEAWLDHSSN